MKDLGDLFLSIWVGMLLVWAFMYLSTFVNLSPGLDEWRGRRVMLGKPPYFSWRRFLWTMPLLVLGIALKAL